MAPQPFDDHIGIQQDLIHSSISDAECLREASGYIALYRRGPFDPSKLLLTGGPIRPYRSFLFLRIFLGRIREQVPIPFGLFAGSWSKGFSQYRRPDRVAFVSSRCILYITMPDSLVNLLAGGRGHRLTRGCRRYCRRDRAGHPGIPGRWRNAATSSSMRISDNVDDQA